MKLRSENVGNVCVCVCLRTCVYIYGHFFFFFLMQKTHFGIWDVDGGNTEIKESSNVNNSLLRFLIKYAISLTLNLEWSL